MFVVLCEEVLSGQLDEHFSEHMRLTHNVTRNQEFLFATMMNGVKDRRESDEVPALVKPRRGRPRKVSVSRRNLSIANKAILNP